MERYSWGPTRSEDEREMLVDELMGDPIWCRNFLLDRLTEKDFDDLDHAFMEETTPYRIR